MSTLAVGSVRTATAKRPIASTTPRAGVGAKVADVKVGVRIAAALATVTVLAGVVGVVGLSSLSSLHSDTLLVQSNVVGSQTLERVDGAAVGAERDMLDANIATNGAPSNALIASADAELATAASALTTYRETADPGRQTQLVDAAQANLVGLTTAWTSKLKALSNGDPAAFNSAWAASGQPAANHLQDRLTALVAYEGQQATAAAAKARCQYSSARTRVLLALAAALVGAIGFGLVVTRGIIRPLRRVTEVARALAGGDLTQRAGVTSKDETGQTAVALDGAIDNLRDIVLLLSGSAEQVSRASGELTAASDVMAEGADDSAQQAAALATAAEEVSASATTVAGATEEMGAGVREISRTAAEASDVGREAAELAAEAGQTVERLGQASAEVSGVIALITSIAEQTNLLALNATIEAARAGEAGRGFAVVANEVKALSEQTGAATGEISAKIEAMRSNATGAIEAITRIQTVVTNLDAGQTTIAGAIEEQVATTSEIARTVSEAASGADQIAASATQVATGAENTRNSSAQTRSAAEELASISQELVGTIGRFRI